MSTSTALEARDAGRFEIPVLFEQNDGQFATDAHFVSRAADRVTLFKAREVEWVFPPARRTRTIPPSPPSSVSPSPASVRFRLLAADDFDPPRGRDRIRAGANYFYGNDADNWLSNVSQYRGVEYKGVYDRIDLVFHGKRGVVEYDFIVHPGGDPNRIKVSVEGASGLAVNDAGDLVVTTNSGHRLVHEEPSIYQTVGSRAISVDGRFHVIDHTSYRFEVGPYDRNLDLVIDPILYATPMPGGLTSQARFVELDAEGYVYIAGQTEAPNFPTTANAIESRCSPDLLCGGYDGRLRSNVFLLKLDPSAAGDEVMVYSSYVPASGIVDFKVDSSGVMYLMAGAKVVDFPTTPNAFDNRCKEEPVPLSRGDFPQMACDTGVVVKLDPTQEGKGSLLYSTYFDGIGQIAFDQSGNIYVGGRTTSPTFPVTEGAFDSVCGMDGLCDRGQGDAFFSKFDPTAPAERSLAYSTLLGELGWERELDWHVTDSGAIVFLLDLSYSVDSNLYTAIPTTSNAIATNRRGGGLGDFRSDIYIGILEPKGNGLSDLKFGTFLGGKNRQDVGEQSLAVSENGYITIAIQSPLGGLPVTPNIVPNPNVSTPNLYILQLDPSRTDPVVYGTYLGGNSIENIAGAEVDNDGFIYVLGTTLSSDLPTRGAFYFGCGGGGPCGDSNWFLAKLDPRRQDSLVYASYGGGQGSDGVKSFFVGSEGNVFVSVTTTSTTLPVTEGRADRRFDDGYLIEVNTKLSGPDSISYAAFVGGSGGDSILDLQQDSSGRIHVVGFTGSSDFGFGEDAIGTLHQSGGFYALLSGPD